jgi:hydroxymethylpyrimidine/phosphomethylpyrimidine kinase
MGEPRRPRLLTIAGSDSSGGAGIQADLRAFAAHGAGAASVVTAVTAQSREAVMAIHVVPPEVVAAQIAAVLADGAPDAVKVGMLGTVAIVEVVATALASLRGVPLVIDPVLASSSGAPLLAEGALGALREGLFPLATLITPNLPEAARLTGLPVEDEGQRVRAGRALVAPGGAVLIKGGHGGGAELVDLLITREAVLRFAHPRVARGMRGTGCTLSAAIAARLGRGEPLAAAVRGAIDFVQAAWSQ